MKYISYLHRNARALKRPSVHRNVLTEESYTKTSESHRVARVTGSVFHLPSHHAEHGAKLPTSSRRSFPRSGEHRKRPNHNSPSRRARARDFMYLLNKKPRRQERVRSVDITVDKETAIRKVRGRGMPALTHHVCDEAVRPERESRKQRYRPRVAERAGLK